MLLRNPAATYRDNQKLWHHGNSKLLGEPLHAVLCSRACPGDKIIEAIDLAQHWRVENRSVISGFHTPVEKECLRIFLRGTQYIVICPARGIDPFLLPAAWQQKFERGEMLIINSREQIGALQLCFVDHHPTAHCPEILRDSPLIWMILSPERLRIGVGRN